jgi:hypothetical protein
VLSLWPHSSPDGFIHRAFRLKRLASVFPIGYIPCMEWSVEYTDAFGAWWDSLTAEEQEDVNTVVILLQRFGPALRFPYSSSIASSRHAHMSELRVQHAGPTASSTPLIPGAQRFC